MHVSVNLIGRCKVMLHLTPEVLCHLANQIHGHIRVM